MNHDDHVALLRPGIISANMPPTWADLGAGDGAFTLALAELLGNDATIYTVDRDSRALASGKDRLARAFPAVNIMPVVADFRYPLDLPPLDGLVMANALHFVRDPQSLIHQFRAFLRPGAPFIVVEYNVDRGNHWAPFPFTFERWGEMARQAGFHNTRLLGRRSSRFLREIYAAAST
jgi:ubiquinone/menaquinone biosynthesis C-methylase UbiE